MIAPAKPPPFPHQLEAIRWAVPRLLPQGGVLLNHRVGTGKTRTALGIAKTLQCRRILVLAPLVALGVWKAETLRWWPQAAVRVLRDLFQIPYVGDTPLVCVTNYDQLRSSERMQVLLRWDPGIVICDESHLLKSAQTKRSRTARRLCLNRMRVLLTGTPADTPLDWYGQFKIIAPQDEQWAQSFTSYRKRVARLRNLGDNVAIVKGFHPEIVREVATRHVAPYTHIVGDVLHLPEPIEQPITHELSAHTREVYDDLRHKYVAEMADGTVVTAINALAKFSKLLQICSGFLKDSDSETIHTLDADRVATLQALLEQDPTMPTLIATVFNEQVRVTQQVIERITGNPPGTITGATPHEDRTRYVEEFQAGKRTHLIVNYQAGGVALTLTAAKRLILYSLPLSSILLEQMRGRVWRAGQTGHVLIQPLLAEDTLEPPLWEALLRKASDVDLARILSEEIKKEEK